MNRLTTIDGKPIYGFRFRSMALARGFASKAIKPLWIILGDHPEFWVVRPVDAGRLERAGYEYADCGREPPTRKGDHPMTREADKNAGFGCQAHYADITKLLAWIGQACQCYTKGEVTWAHAGSLSHVRQQLIETFAFIAGEEPEAIEEKLAALAADSHSRKT